MELDASRLLDAIDADDVDAVVSLLQPHSNATDMLRRLRDNAQEPLVHNAIRRNRPQLLDVLLNHGFVCEDEQGDDEDDEDDDEEDEEEDDHVYHGRTPLSLAVSLGHADCVHVLLAHGARSDTQNHADGTCETALHVAALCHSVELLDALLAASRSVDVRDMSDATPLFLAVTYEQRDVAQHLVRAGADVHARDACCATPLHAAATNGDCCLIGLLLDHGANVDARDVDLNTPLINAGFANRHSMSSVAWNDPVGQSRAIVRLLAQGADVHASNRHDNTALYGALWNGYLDAVSTLLDSGANTRTRNRKNETVLHIAARAGMTSVEIWTRLLRDGADPHARDSDGRTCHDVWIARAMDPSAHPLVSEHDHDVVACLLMAAI